MPAPVAQHAKHQQLLRDGFCVFPGVLTPALLAELRATTDAILAAYPKEKREFFKYQGSSIMVDQGRPAYAELIGWPGALEAMKTLGYDAGLRYWIGYLLSKPPQGPALYWHQDWVFWSDPVSADPNPSQLFLMYYLTDTSRENGCLRVIPGTHRRRIDLHDQLGAAHTDKTYHADPNSPIFATHPDEIDLPVRAGDLVIGDARVLHAAHPNRSDRERSVITLWYYPRFDEMPETIRGIIAASAFKQIPQETAPPLRGRLEQLIPVCTTASVPAPSQWDRVPGEHLRR
ncbi:MAG: phytanoyl-CoA dioxygenase family protein [Planctomycetes bacterium]|nr:phytanoyl-CoA dioxygenase family protein [Planctomycetota bacterium]